MLNFQEVMGEGRGKRKKERKRRKRVTTEQVTETRTLQSLAKAMEKVTKPGNRSVRR